MKKICSIVLVLLLFLPNLTLANGIIGPEDPNKNISRAEMATVSTRLLGLEDFRDFYDKKGEFKDVKGWALPFVNIASEEGVMVGNSKDTFNPNGNLTYVEVLTVLMRILGYEDGVDFKKYPEDYYAKALDIGLGDMYIGHKEVITRKIASDTIDRALELHTKDGNLRLMDNLGVPDTETNVEDYVLIEDVTIDNIKFNTSIVGMFSGNLKGFNNFTNYEVELLSKSGQVYKTKTLDKSGTFTITGFDVGTMSKISGYKYKIYDAQGNLVLSSDLQ